MHSHGAPAVRALCEFTAKEGDLDLRFTPSPTAQEGIARHQTVVARRGADYQAELPLVGSWPNLTLPGVIVSGRADGYDPEQNLLEEIKTHRGDFARIPENHRRSFSPPSPPAGARKRACRCAYSNMCARQGL